MLTRLQGFYFFAYCSICIDCHEKEATLPTRGPKADERTMVNVQGDDDQ